MSKVGRILKHTISQDGSQEARSSIHEIEEEREGGGGIEK